NPLAGVPASANPLLLNTRLGGQRNLYLLAGFVLRNTGGDQRVHLGAILLVRPDFFCDGVVVRPTGRASVPAQQLLLPLCGSQGEFVRLEHNLRRHGTSTPVEQLPRLLLHVWQAIGKDSTSAIPGAADAVAERFEK